jgi:hypothetical protein
MSLANFVEGGVHNNNNNAPFSRIFVCSQQFTTTGRHTHDFRNPIQDSCVRYAGLEDHSYPLNNSITSLKTIISITIITVIVLSHFGSSFVMWCELQLMAVTLASIFHG